MNGIVANFQASLGNFNLKADLSIPDKGIISLFGPSGSGKTSILRFLAGLNQFEGKLSIGGDIWQDSNEKIFVPSFKRSIGFIFQDASLFSNMNVRENISFGLKYTKDSFDLIEIAKLVGIEHLLDRSCEMLSGGEKQRVAIARAIVRKPKLLLMDEPLASLDGKARSEILSFLLKIKLELSIPIIYVSHSIDEVLYLADHVVLVEGGRIKSSGPIHELSTQLGDALEGPGVLLKCRYKDFDKEFGLSRVTLGEEILYIPWSVNPETESVLVRIMAKNVSLAKSRITDSSILNILKGVVVSFEEGKAADVSVDLNCSGSIVKAKITKKSAHNLDLKVGQELYLQIKSVSLML